VNEQVEKASEATTHIAIATKQAYEVQKIGKCIHECGRKAGILLLLQPKISRARGDVSAVFGLLQDADFQNADGRKWYRSMIDHRSG